MKKMIFYALCALGVLSLQSCQRDEIVRDNYVYVEKDVPVLNITRKYDITFNSAKVDCSVVWNSWEYYVPGSTTVGVLVSTRPNPTESGKFYTTYGLNKGITSFTTQLFDLKPNTKYYILGYADDIEMGYTSYSLQMDSIVTGDYIPVQNGLQYTGDMMVFYRDSYSGIEYDANYSNIVFYEDGAGIGHGEEIDYFANGPIAWQSSYFTYVENDENGTLTMTFPGNHDLDCTVFVTELNTDMFAGYYNGDVNDSFRLKKLTGFNDWFRYSADTFYGYESRGSNAKSVTRSAANIMVMSSFASQKVKMQRR